MDACLTVFLLKQMHFVNWNHKLYANPDAASSSNNNDGLVVLAKFIKVVKIIIKLIDQVYFRLIIF